MARKAREILKGQGYTDQELDALVLLNDPKFCKSIEAHDAELEKAKADIAMTSEWYYKTAVPTLEKAVNDSVAAQAERAKLEAQLKAEQAYGMRRVADQQGGGDNGSGQGRTDGQGAGAQGSGAGAPDYQQLDNRYVNSDTFKQAFSQTGDAIAMAADIAEDHRDLFGKKLPEGVGGLRAKYNKATQTGFNGTLRDFWEREYNVGARREEVQAKERQEHEDKIRQDERVKVLSEFGNPNTRPMTSSNSPFVRRPAATGTDGSSGAGQPWEKGNPNQRSTDRVLKFGTKFLQQQHGGNRQ